MHRMTLKIIQTFDSDIQTLLSWDFSIASFSFLNQISPLVKGMVPNVYKNIIIR